MAKTSAKRENKEVRIIADRCKECDFCIEFCPQQVLQKSKEINIKGYHPVYITDDAKCTRCDICGMICPDFAIGVVDAKTKSKETASAS